MHASTRRARAALIATVLVLAACSNDGASSADPTSTPAATTEPSTTDPAAAPSTSPVSTSPSSGGPTTVAPTETPPVSRWTPGDCRYELPDLRTSCGTIDVPEDYDRPDGRRIQLPVVIVHAIKGPATADPLVYLPGGPGASAFGTLGLASDAAPLFRDRDLIVMEQRGNGESTPSLVCTEEDFAACHGRLTGDGIGLEQYSTANSARDLVELRRSLGIDEWNVWGVSYGVSTAFALLRIDEAATRSVILDSGSEPRDIARADLESILDGYTQLFRGCAADLACASTYGDLRTKFLATFDRLRDAPLPIDGTGLDAIVGSPTMGGTGFALLTHQLQLSPGLTRIPAFIDALDRGDLDAAIDILSGLAVPESPAPEGFDPARDFSLGLYLSVYCAETPFTTVDTEPLQTLEPWPDAVIEAVTPDYLTYCRSGVWPVPPVDPSVLEPVVTATRALFLAGEYDPLTPPRQSEIGSVGFSNATVVTVTGATHGLIPVDECATLIAAAFVDDPDRTVDQSCLTDRQPPVFVAPAP